MLGVEISMAVLWRRLGNKGGLRTAPHDADVLGSSHHATRLVPYVTFRRILCIPTLAAAADRRGIAIGKMPFHGRHVLSRPC